MATLSPDPVTLAPPQVFPLPLAGGGLEHLLALPDEEPRKAGLILADFVRTPVFVLGSPIGPVIGFQASEINILRYVAEMDGSDRSFIPVFTSPDWARNAQERNPDWEGFQLLGVNGGDLMRSVEGDVSIAINPWSRLGYILRPIPG
jgi:hypothetical protein